MRHFNSQKSLHAVSGERSLRLQNDNPIVRLNKAHEQENNEARRPLPPTLEACAELQYAYTYFNEALFNGKLADCVIVYTRKKNVLGHFAPDRFQRIDGRLWPELALNPTYLALREDRESLSTLAHEQAHVWRHYLGPLNQRGGRGSNGYHDTVWADCMERIGLMPSDTGLPGGKRIGSRMTHYIIKGGSFDVACARLLDEGFQIHWRDRVVFASGASGGDPGDPTDPANLPKKKDRVKFTCPNEACGLNAWARPTAKLTCGFCDLPMISVDAQGTALIPL